MTKQLEMFSPDEVQPVCPDAMVRLFHGITQELESRPGHEFTDIVSRVAMRLQNFDKDRAVAMCARLQGAMQHLGQHSEDARVFRAPGEPAHEFPSALARAAAVTRLRANEAFDVVALRNAALEAMQAGGAA